MNEYLLNGLTRFQDDEEAPYESVEEVIETEEELRNSANEVEASMTKMIAGTLYISELYAVKEYIETYGVDRSLLFMYNRDNKLGKILKVHFPSCESFDAVGSPDSPISIAALESIGESIVNALKTLREELLRPYTAIRRFVQTMTSDVRKSKSKLIELKDKLKSVRALPEGEIRAMPPHELEKWFRVDPTKLRERALLTLKDMQDWGWSEGINDTGLAAANQLEDDIEVAENAEPENQRIALKTFGSINTVMKHIDYCMKACDHIEKVDDAYHGFWMTGFNQGKAQFLLGGGILAPVFWVIRKNVIRVARASWRNMNTLSRIDRDVIHSTIRVARACAKD